MQSSILPAQPVRSHRARRSNQRAATTSCAHTYVSHGGSRVVGVDGPAPMSSSSHGGARLDVDLAVAHNHMPSSSSHDVPCCDSRDIAEGWPYTIREPVVGHGVCSSGKVQFNARGKAEISREKLCQKLAPANLSKHLGRRILCLLISVWLLLLYLPCVCNDVHFSMETQQLEFEEAISVDTQFYASNQFALSSPFHVTSILVPNVESSIPAYIRVGEGMTEGGEAVRVEPAAPRPLAISTAAEPTGVSDSPSTAWSSRDPPHGLVPRVRAEVPVHIPVLPLESPLFTHHICGHSSRESSGKGVCAKWIRCLNVEIKVPPPARHSCRTSVPVNAPDARVAPVAAASVDGGMCCATALAAFLAPVAAAGVVDMPRGADPVPHHGPQFYYHIEFFSSKSTHIWMSSRHRGHVSICCCRTRAVAPHRSIPAYGRVSPRINMPYSLEKQVRARVAPAAAASASEDICVMTLSSTRPASAHGVASTRVC